jgi:hypothetical protein
LTVHLFVLCVVAEVLFSLLGSSERHEMQVVEDTFYTATSAGALFVQPFDQAVPTGDLRQDVHGGFWFPPKVLAKEGMDRMFLLYLAHAADHGCVSSFVDHFCGLEADDTWKLVWCRWYPLPFLH